MSSWDEMSDAPDEVRSLLAQAKRSQSMTSAEYARNAARITKIAATPVVTAGLGPITKGALWGGGIGFAALAIAALVVPHVMAARREANAAPPIVHPSQPARVMPHARPVDRPVENVAPAAVRDDSAATPSAETPRAPIAAPPSIRARTMPRPTEPVATQPQRVESNPSSSANGSGASGANPADALTREAALLGRAQATLASDPAAALEQLGEHLREFPRGQFAADREFLAVDALLRLGRRDEARRRADALATDHPRSVYVARVRRMIGSATSETIR
jgi:hypothetical protein